MTLLQREALQMCLEYIETDAHERRHVRWKINEALAQPQQEPVLLNGLTEAETNSTASVVGLTLNHAPCLGMDCGITRTDQIHSAECQAEHAAAIAGGKFVKPAQPQQEPVDFASLLREAEEIVQGKPTWNRFIDATPLANDIAVWMTVFAQDVARRDAPPAQREPLTDEEIKQFASKHLDVGDGSYATHFVTGDVAFARAIEAAHGIKENT